MLGLQILIDGFAVSALYGLGAVGFTLIFGVSGVLNLSHGAIMVTAATVAWALAERAGAYGGALGGLASAFLLSFVTYFAVVRPIQRSRSIPSEETEIFVLTGTLLWGIMIQVAIAYLATTSPHTVRPLISGVTVIGGVRTPTNEILTAALCWAAIGALTLLIERTRAGKALLAASVNPRGLTLLGFELERVHLLVWAIYGVLVGVAGVLLGAFLGASSDNVGTLTASAFSIVVLGGLGSVPGSLLAAYCIGYLETLTAYLVSPSLRNIPALILLVAVVWARPQGFLGRR
ncbi:branched-chain amino acid ABC transporter permease [Lichenibacterium minor]|uniref:Branched-chain amino acid ABC transporter permease n=1 Tax=Lichenibacterium minor TaxID=2316528 RepID=A0A4Q2U291_9HYPH|nr:branched-chain amino acid ABC transporter permease [Lichenibacterium minor]RYC30603.1 branched-chain amino acid ABC transporter permease [Lichenibacterium minor]